MCTSPYLCRYIIKTKKDMHHNFKWSPLKRRQKIISFSICISWIFYKTKHKNPRYSVVTKSSILQQMLMALFMKYIQNLITFPTIITTSSSKPLLLLAWINSGKLILLLQSLPLLQCIFHISQGHLLKI